MLHCYPTSSPDSLCIVFCYCCGLSTSDVSPACKPIPLLFRNDTVHLCLSRWSPKHHVKWIISMSWPRVRAPFTFDRNAFCLHKLASSSPRMWEERSADLRQCTLRRSWQTFVGKRQTFTHARLLTRGGAGGVLAKTVRVFYDGEIDRATSKWHCSSDEVWST